MGGFLSGADVRYIYYVLASILGAVGVAALTLAARRAALPLRPWCAAGIPAAVGFSALNLIRVCGYDPAWFADVGRGINLYALAVLYSGLPFAAAKARPVSHMLDSFVDEVGRQIRGPV